MVFWQDESKGSESEGCWCGVYLCNDPEVGVHAVAIGNQPTSPHMLKLTGPSAIRATKRFSSAAHDDGDAGPKRRRLAALSQRPARGPAAPARIMQPCRPQRVIGTRKPSRRAWAAAAQNGYCSEMWQLFKKSVADPPPSGTHFLKSARQRSDLIGLKW